MVPRLQTETARRSIPLVGRNFTRKTNSTFALVALIRTTNGSRER